MEQGVQAGYGNAVFSTKTVLNRQETITMNK